MYIRKLLGVYHTHMLSWHRLALHMAASSWIFVASFVDHESTVSYVSVCLHCLHDGDKTELHLLGAWKWARNGVGTNPWVGTISRTRDCSGRNDYASGFVPAE